MNTKCTLLSIKYISPATNLCGYRSCNQLISKQLAGNEAITLSNAPIIFTSNYILTSASTASYKNLNYKGRETKIQACE